MVEATTVDGMIDSYKSGATRVDDPHRPTRG
jgi:hypothetical protein